MSKMIQTLARGITDPLRSRVVPLSIPMAPDFLRGWKPTILFQGATEILQNLSCHASVLIPGRSPHPPHRHEEDEMLMILAGEADVTLPDVPSAVGETRLRLSAGQFVYYPSGFAHTIEATGKQPANYLMVRWTGQTAGHGRPLSFQQFDRTGLQVTEPEHTGLHSVRFLEGPTSTLRKIEGHLTSLCRNGGYEPHADSHDVILVMLEGEVETLGQKIGPFGAVFYRAGEPHGIHNPGETAARYLVLEFHGTEVPLSESLPFRLLNRVARRVLPGRVRRRIGRALGRLARRHGKA